MRTSPRESATMLEPSFTTAVLTRRRLSGHLGSAGLPTVRIQLERHPADLHVVARLEARRLERPDDAQPAQPVLHVFERLVVLGVVARDQPLDPQADDAERAIRRPLDGEPLV